MLQDLLFIFSVMRQRQLLHKLGVSLGSTENSLCFGLPACLSVAGEQ